MAGVLDLDLARKCTDTNLGAALKIVSHSPGAKTEAGNYLGGFW
jgi:hypothetical protein